MTLSTKSPSTRPCFRRAPFCWTRNAHSHPRSPFRSTVLWPQYQGRRAMGQLRSATSEEGRLYYLVASSSTPVRRVGVLSVRDAAAHISSYRPLPRLLLSSTLRGGTPYHAVNPDLESPCAHQRRMLRATCHATSELGGSTGSALGERSMTGVHRGTSRIEEGRMGHRNGLRPRRDGCRYAV